MRSELGAPLGAEKRERAARPATLVTPPDRPPPVYLDWEHFRTKQNKNTANRVASCKPPDSTETAGGMCAAPGVSELP